MTLGLQQREKLYNLLDQLFDDQLAAADQRQLSLLIESSDEALDIYLSEMNRHAALAWDWSIGLEGDGVEGGVEKVASDQPLVASGQWPVASENNLPSPASGRGVGGEGGGQPEKVVGSQWPVASEANPKSQINKSQIPNLPPPVSIVLDDSTRLSPLSPLPFYISHPFVFSNLFALLVIGIGALGAWFYQIDIPKPMARVDRPTASPGKSSGVEKLTFVGQITGMVDVRWADESTAALGGARVPLGRKYALASGLMEITYDTGAKVILQGPVTYEVDSRAGGFLSVGRLTARLEKKGSGVRGQGSEGANLPSPASGRGAGGEGGPQLEKVVGGQPLVVSGQWLVASKEGAGVRGQGPEAANHKSEIRNQKSLAPMFAVRTPTAIVTDLGTEFGVEVSKNGDSECHVFQGSVETVALNHGKPDAQPSRLTAGQTGLVTSDKTASSRTYKVFVTENHADSRRFMRSMPTAAQMLHQVACDWRIGARDEFKIAKDDLVNAGQSTLGKIELVAGEASFSSDVLKLIDGDTYAGQREDVSQESFTPKDGAVVVITLNTSLHPHGYDVKSIVSLTGSYGEAGQNRSSQKYDVAYAAVDAPNKYIPLRSKEKNTVNCSAFGMKEVQVTLTSSGNYPMASGVAKLRFTFHNTDTPDPESMYREIDVIGTPVAESHSNISTTEDK